ncbi:hypothetical protein N332_06284, partial [Mesitornis unicolor]
QLLPTLELLAAGSLALLQVKHRNRFPAKHWGSLKTLVFFKKYHLFISALSLPKVIMGHGAFTLMHRTHRHFKSLMEKLNRCTY